MAKKKKTKAPGQRQLRVGEELRHVLAGVLARGGLRDPVLAGRSITISQIRVSPDLRRATAFAMPLGGTVEAAELLEALNRAAPWLSHEVGRRITLKYTPALRFELDTVFDEAQRIDALLRSPSVARDLASDDSDVPGDGT
jgi:ribosome-binding factor A